MNTFRLKTVYTVGHVSILNNNMRLIIDEVFMTNILIK